MKRYPKVPRYNHDFVKSEWFDSDTYVLEKYDGSNLRFTLYDERFSEYYDLNLEHGTFIIGSKKVYKSEEDIDELNSQLKFEERLQFIKDTVNKDRLFRLHELLDSPITFYGENMVRHTLEYNWNEIPQIILFDMYAPALDSRRDKKPEHPYKEVFSGFLDWIDVVRIANYVTDIPTASCVMKGISFDEVSRDIFEDSEYRDNQKPEGYIFRNDTKQHRVKIRTEEFKELNKYIWGQIDEDNPDTAKEIAYMYAGRQRIREKILDVFEGTASETVLEESVPVIAKDIWEEEWNEFCNREFNPYKLHTYIAERVKATMLRPELFNIPSELKDIAEDWTYSGRFAPDTVTPDNTTQYIISSLSDEKLTEFYNEIVSNSEKPAGNWIIQPLADRVHTYIWYANMDMILQIDSEINGDEIHGSVYDVIVPFVKNQS